MKNIIVAFLLLAVLSASAQENESIDKKMVKVHLKDGSIISGALQSWTYQEEVNIITQGVTLKFPNDKVRRVVEVDNFSKVKEPIIHQDKGIYYTAKAQILSGNEGNRAHNRIGYGLTASAGYQWNQYLGAGIGTGYRQLIWDTGEKMIPIFAEVKGFLSNKAVRPFYNMEIGYSFGLTDEELSLIKSKGGLLLYPSFGISFGRQKMKYSFDIGYLFQDAELTYGSNFDDRVRTVQDIKYQRLTLRFGMSF